MIDQADKRQKQGVANVEFHLATIDRLPLADASVDCIVSNCVINLAPDKAAVFREMFRILKPGGRVAVSDITLKQALPAELSKSVAAYVGCIAGAITIAEYERLLRAAGFDVVQVVDTRKDLNAYAKVENQVGCCVPTTSEAACCTPAAVASTECCGRSPLKHYGRRVDRRDPRLLWYRTGRVLSAHRPGRPDREIRRELLCRQCQVYALKPVDRPDYSPLTTATRPATGSCRVHRDLCPGLRRDRRRGVNELTGAFTHVGVALTFGLVVLALIYALGGCRGHFNPAVTIGFVLAQRFPARDAGPYLIVQLLGAIAASVALRLIFPDSQTLGATLPRGSAIQSFVLELLLTTFLMFVILNSTTGAKEKGLVVGIIVGSVIAMEALFAGPISGASMNPARSLGPAVVSGGLDSRCVYLLAPVLGAAAAVLGCTGVQKPGCCAMGETEMSVKRVLFVCVENSNRSQMAQAFARIHGGDGVEAFSAGSRPSGKINPKAVEAMREIGYDLSTHHSKSLDEIPAGPYDATVTMGCGDACPNVAARVREDWEIPDPRDMPPDQFREVRDLIGRKVADLFKGCDECEAENEW